jgi:hypothetical protein
MSVTIDTDDVAIDDIVGGSVIVSYTVRVLCRGDCAAATAASEAANNAVLAAADAGAFAAGRFQSAALTPPPSPPSPLPEPAPAARSTFVDRRGTAAGGAAGAGAGERAGFGSVNDMMIAVFGGAGFAAVGGCVLLLLCRTIHANQRKKQKVAAYNPSAAAPYTEKVSLGRPFDPPPRRYTRRDFSASSVSPERVPPMSRRAERLPPVQAATRRGAGAAAGAGVYAARHASQNSRWTDQSTYPQQGARRPRAPP